MAKYMTFMFFAGFIAWWVYHDAYHIKTPEYQAQAEIRSNNSLASQLNESVRYLRDTTTGICFAKASVGVHGFGFATVDCDKLTNVQIIDFASQ